MSTPFYVSPQQAMADRAEYARKGIARGRSVVVLQYTDGVVFVAENPSRALHKVSEIYDRIAFAAVGKYNEFENLRIGGVRYADLRGYTYDREDVTARGLANVYAQTLGTIFSSAAEKPYEVELIVAEVGAAPEDDQIYRLPHDGSIVDEHGSVAVGGNADQISTYLDQRHRDGMTLAEALKLAVDSLSRDNNGGERTLTAEQLEVATLDRTRPQQRKFKRILGRQLSRLLDESGGADAGDAAADADADAGAGESGTAAEGAGDSAKARGPRARALRARTAPRSLALTSRCGADAPVARPGGSLPAGARGVFGGVRGGAVEPRMTSSTGRAGASAGRPSSTAIRARIPASPNSSAGRRTVVSSGSTAMARARSSKPVTETSSGTRRPSRRTALQAPAAMVSSSQSSAVGRGPGAVRAASCGVQPGVDAEGGRFGGAAACRGHRRSRGDGAGAQVEGPGVDIGREVGDAAVAEPSQMAGQVRACRRRCRG